MVAAAGRNTARLMARSSWRFYRRHPAQLLLSLLGIVLGVSVVSAVLITNSSSQRAFALSTETLYGRATHQIEGAQGIDQARYVQLVRALPTLEFAPIIEGYAAVGDEVFSLIGLDPFVEAPFGRGMEPSRFSESSTGDDAGEAGSATADAGVGDIDLLLQPGLLMSAYTLARLAVEPRDSLQLDVAGRSVSVPLLGTVGDAASAGSDGLLVGDIAVVQELLGRGSRIDRIDVIAEPAEVDSLAGRAARQPASGARQCAAGDHAGDDARLPDQP